MSADTRSRRARLIRLTATSPTGLLVSIVDGTWSLVIRISSLHDLELLPRENVSVRSSALAKLPYVTAWIEGEILECEHERSVEGRPLSEPGWTTHLDRTFRSDGLTFLKDVVTRLGD